MPNIRQFMLRDELALDSFAPWRTEDILAYGTSQGVEKAWDSRGRGKKAAEVAKKGARIARTAGAPKIPKRLLSWAQRSYNAMKSDDKVIARIQKKSSAKRILLKHAWFAKRLGDLMESFDGFKELAETAYKVVEKLGKVLLGVGGVHELAVALHHATMQLAPVIHHLTVIASHSGGAM